MRPKTSRGALLLAVRLATLELKLDAFVYMLERRYRPDQRLFLRVMPRAGNGLSRADRKERVVPGLLSRGT